MKFCSECAHPVFLQTPIDDNRPRYVCSNCNIIHYQNPKIVVGSIPVWKHYNELCILLCKRAIEPRYGYWTLPAGFMENGETTTDAAIRETKEEAGARVQLEGLFSLINLPFIYQVHFFYRASLLDLNYTAGIESLEVNLFTEKEIPWSKIAFTTVEYTLRSYFTDLNNLKQGTSNFCLHTKDIRKNFMQSTLSFPVFYNSF